MTSTEPNRLEGQPWDYRSAAQFSGLSERTLRRLVKCNQLKAVRVGRRVLLPDSAVRKLVNGGVQ